MFAPRYFGERYYPPRYYPPASNIQGGAGSIQPGGFRIGFFQDAVRFRSKLPEAAFEVPESEVLPTSFDIQAEIERFQSILDLLQASRELIISARELSEFQIRSELDHIQMMEFRAEQGAEFLRQVKKRRMDEESIMAIIVADD